MMETNPAITALLAAHPPEFLFGQVLIQTSGSTFGLRHEADRALSTEQLRLVAGEEIRATAQFTADGAFRPLKTAPNLRRGWRVMAESPTDLLRALDYLYPGAVANWFARKNGAAATSYRDFTSRQTGMYRRTAGVDDATAGALARACCHPDSCRKQRLWPAGTEGPENSAVKSIIPCLEPCAILLEFARKMARLEYDEKAGGAPPIVQLTVTPPEAAAMECDFDDPGNPRRQRFFLEKAAAAAKPPSGN